uniref:Uncharacterized protein n=1 Tax=Anabas testudineus TaxID=64144 RepID=A0A3Q1ICI5_ANATE
MNQDKWAQTGWRIEQKYANKVLLGNWAEERLQGLPSKLLFAHGGVPSSHYLWTHYEENYGRHHTNTLSTPRHSHNLTWQSERSDQPLTGKTRVSLHCC